MAYTLEEIKEVLGIRPKGWSENRFQRFLNAITAIHNRNEYPSAARILKELGRNSKSMNAQEVHLRYKVFKKLGIQVRVQTNKPDFHEGGTLDYPNPYA